MQPLSGQGLGLESVADAVVQLNEWSQRLQGLLGGMLPNAGGQPSPTRRRMEPARTYERPSTPWRERPRADASLPLRSIDPTEADTPNISGAASAAGPGPGALPRGSLFPQEAKLDVARADLPDAEHVGFTKP
jgi:hypothetical protein